MFWNTAHKHMLFLILNFIFIQGDYPKLQKRSHIPASSGDVPLGFASVDLGPIAAGLRQLIGWYNIMDFNGKCRGQIKVQIGST